MLADDKQRTVQKNGVRMQGSCLILDAALGELQCRHCGRMRDADHAFNSSHAASAMPSQLVVRYRPVLPHSC